MSRKKKIKTAKTVRKVKAGMLEQVKLGIITRKEYRTSMKTIGRRMRRGE